jgi:hypothetical protein
MDEAEVRSLESGANAIISNKLEHKIVGSNKDQQT